MTDGENTGSLDTTEGDSRSYKFHYDRVAIRENGITTLGDVGGSTNKRFNNQVTEAVIAHYDKTTGSRTVNYFLTDKTKGRMQYLYNQEKGWSKESDIAFNDGYKKTWLKDGYLEIDGLNGFRKSFAVRHKDLGAQGSLEVSGDKKGDLVRGFKKFQSSKSTSRKFITRFVDEIS